MLIKKPYLIDFPKTGVPETGYIYVAEISKLIPFDIKRIFWTTVKDSNTVRGKHAHLHTEQLLIAMTGNIMVTTEMPDGETKSFLLETPAQGLYIPANVWHTMEYTSVCLQLVLASTEYKESDYIRDYQKFKEIWKK